MDKRKYYQLKREAFKQGVRVTYNIIQSDDSHAVVQADASMNGEIVTTFGEVRSDTPVVDAMKEADMLAFTALGVIKPDETEAFTEEETLVEAEKEMPESNSESKRQKDDREPKSFFGGLMSFMSRKANENKIHEEDVSDDDFEDIDIPIIGDDVNEDDVYPQMKDLDETPKDIPEEKETLPELETVSEIKEEIPETKAEEPIKEDVTEEKKENISAEEDSQTFEKTADAETAPEPEPEVDDNFSVMIGRYKNIKNNTIKELIEKDPKFLVNIMSIERPSVEYRKYIAMIREYMDRHDITMEDLERLV